MTLEHPIMDRIEAMPKTGSRFIIGQRILVELETEETVTTFTGEIEGIGPERLIMRDEHGNRWSVDRAAAKALKVS